MSASFKFKKTDQIGAAGAEEDELLAACFVDTGDLSLVKSINDHRSIVLGRTGTGKTALLARLEQVKGDNVIKICPENLALTYITNSTILNYFSNLGVNLDPLFKLLWRHVLTVEILLRHFQEPGVKKQKSLLDKISALFTGSSRHDKEMLEAIKYLEEWGKSFWLETEFRVKEIAQKVENELNTEISLQLGIPSSKVGTSLKTAGKFSQDQRTELLSRGQEIISKAQVQDLNKIMKLLDSVLENRQKHYYIIIDRLDENWVEEKIRYKLIMALIQTSRDFIRVKHAKIIIAIRRDLIERVFRLTRESGFQEEKYQSLYLPLSWNKEDIMQVLDRRINALVSSRYTKKRVGYIDLLPKKYQKIPITDYIFQVARRPRDIIAFFNSCISAATNLSKLSNSELRSAEGEYSRSRLRALGDEWSADYPSLLDFADILKKRSPSFKLLSIEDKDIEELCLKISISNPGGHGILQQYSMKVVDCMVAAKDFKIFLFQVFYSVGLVGFKLQSFEKESWVDEFGKSISSAEITDNTSVIVHPAYYRSLGIKI